MVFTVRVDGDALDQHHLIILLRPVFEAFEKCFRVFFVSPSPVLPRRQGASWFFFEATPVRVFTDVLQQSDGNVLSASFLILIPRESNPLARLQNTVVSPVIAFFEKSDKRSCWEQLLIPVTSRSRINQIVNNEGSSFRGVDHP